MARRRAALAGTALVGLSIVGWNSMSQSAAPPSSPSAATNLRCVLEAPAQVVAGGPAKLRFTLSTTSATPLRVLRWNTPWEGRWTAPMVDVTRDGEPLAYAGPSAKRGDPSPADYLLLAPGTSLAATLDLALPYDLSRPGTLRVTPRLHVHDVFDAASVHAPAARPRAAHVGRELACEPASVEIVVMPAGG